MSTKINIHADTNKDLVSLESNTYDPTTGSSVRFHTIELSYGNSTVTMFMHNDDSLIDSLNKIIDSAQAKLDAMLTVGV